MLLLQKLLLPIRRNSLDPYDPVKSVRVYSVYDTRGGRGSSDAQLRSARSKGIIFGEQICICLAIFQEQKIRVRWAMPRADNQQHNVQNRQLDPVPNLPSCMFSARMQTTSGMLFDTAF